MGNRRQDLFDYAAENSIQIKIAKETDRSAVGIHLLHPTLDDLQDALNTATRDLFPAIYIHRGNPRGLHWADGVRHLTVVQS